MKRSSRNIDVLEFEITKGKRESRSNNDVNIKRTNSITFTYLLELSLSSSPQDQLRNSEMLCPLK